jgi:hypothetical protein
MRGPSDARDEASFARDPEMMPVEGALSVNGLGLEKIVEVTDDQAVRESFDSPVSPRTHRPESRREVRELPLERQTRVHFFHPQRRNWLAGRVVGRDNPGS